MIHVSFTDLRKRLAHFMDRAVDDRAPVLVTRQGHEPVVMMAQSDYDSMAETLHLLSNPANRERLEQGLAEAERGERIEVTWDEDAQTYRPA
jgi:antitoxin YefM